MHGVVGSLRTPTMAPRDTGALIRAGITKIVVAQLETLPDDVRERVLARLDDDVLPLVDRPLNTTWIDAGLHITTLDALRDTLGDAAFTTYFRDAYLAGFASLPLIKTIIDATIRLFGATPAGLAKNLDRTWQTLARGLGSFEVETHEQEATIAWSGLEPRLATSGTYVDSFAGTFSGWFPQCQVVGEVHIIERDHSRGSATYRLIWK